MTKMDYLALLVDEIHSTINMPEPNDIDSISVL